MDKAYSNELSHNLSKGAELALKTLQNSGYFAYFVGGCVRDCLLGISPKDFDIATNANVEEIKTVFRNHHIICENGERHGTVTVRLEEENVEITTFHHDQGEDATLESDLSHRDLTINSMAYGEDGIIDLQGGMEDLRNGIIRLVEPKTKTIKDDPLRILRTLRFHAKLGFQIEPSTKEVINELAFLLPRVAKERVKKELFEILVAEDIEDLLFDYKPVFFSIIPVLRKMDGYDQTNPWHAYDLYTHTVHVVGKTKPDITIRLSALLHDIGKLVSRREEIKLDGSVVAHYYGHPFKSKAMAERILEDLKIENAVAKKVLFLVEYHDNKVAPTRLSTGKILHKIKGTFKDDPYPYLEDLFNLQRSDILDHAKPIVEYHEQVLSIARTMLQENVPLLSEELSISGNDLRAIGFVKEGIGRAKEKLLFAVIEGKISNETEALYTYARRLYHSGLR